MAITKLVADSLGAGATPNQSAFKNIIINGDMSIAQRGTSQSGVGASDTYLIDRFQLDTNGGVTARFTMSQNTDVPTGQGFSKSLKLDCTTAQTSLGSFHALALMQKFEGQNVQYLKYGTSSAESLTCSFWVKSAKTGTYILEIDADDNGRNINQSYTINSANTWEKKTLTFVGDTASALANDNSNELEVYFWLMASSDFTSGTLQTSWGSTVNANRAVGQINLGDSTSNDFYITGVQLEAGTSASDFEFLPHDVNLQRCERYFEKSYDMSVTPGTVSFSSSITVPPNTGDRHQGVYFKTRKRASATIVIYSPANGASGAIKEDSTNPSASVPDSGESSFRMSVSGGVGTGADAAMHFTAEAEL